MEDRGSEGFQDQDGQPDTVMADLNIDDSVGASSESRSRKRSDIWPFINDLGNGKYSCKCCESEERSQVWNSKAHSTMRKHLLAYHKNEYGGEAETNTAKQTNLMCYGFERVVKQRLGPDFNKDDSDAALINWIVENAWPFAVVEQPKFIVFCSTLQPTYKLPCRQTVRRRVISRWKQEKALTRKTMLSCLIRDDIGPSRTSLTTDMWTSAANRGYMVVTIHWIDYMWNMRSVILGFTRVEYPHTGKRLARNLLAVVRAMDGALLATIWAVTADNATNNGSMVRHIRSTLPKARQDQLISELPSSAAEMSSSTYHGTDEPQNVFRVRCLAHVLQLAVKEGLLKCKFVETSIGTVRDILKKLSDSTSLNEELQRICDVLNVKFQQPKLDCVTRWNSTWEMVVSAIHLRKPIEELLHRIRDHHEGYGDFSIKADDELAAPIDDDAWTSLDEFCKFLTPVKAATTMMSGRNYPTFGMSVVVYELVGKSAAKTIASSSSPYTIKFATAFKSKMDEYDSLVKTPEAYIAAVLDPRAKSLLPKVVPDMAPIRQHVLDEYEAYYRIRYEKQQQNENTPQPNQQAAAEIKLGEVLHHLIDDNFGLDEPANFDGESFVSELDRWIAHRDRTMTSNSSSAEVCAWMKTLDQFPRIRMMARDYLAVMATSVPSEQAFSAAGATVSDRRARLGDDAVSAVSEMQSFIKFNEFSAKLEADR